MRIEVRREERAGSTSKESREGLFKQPLKSEKRIKGNTGVHTVAHVGEERRDQTAGESCSTGQGKSIEVRREEGDRERHTAKHGVDRD